MSSIYIYPELLSSCLELQTDSMQSLQHVRARHPVRTPGYVPGPSASAAASASRQ